MFASFLLQQQVSQRVLHLRRSGFLFFLLTFPSRICWILCRSQPKIEIYRPMKSWSWSRFRKGLGGLWLLPPSNTGPIFVLPRIHPFALDMSSSRGNVYSRHEPGQFNFASSASSMVAKFWQSSAHWLFEDHLEDFRIFVRILASSFSAPNHKSEVGLSWLTSLLVKPLFLVYPPQQVSPCPQDSQKSAKPKLHTYIRYCSVNTQLIEGSNRARNNFNS